MAYVRCSYCNKRRTLARDPENYLRIPPCNGHGCEGRRKRRNRQLAARGRPPLPRKYRVDKYRTKVERNGAVKSCYPGRGGCDGYHFPHRRGSYLCFHNPNRESVLCQLEELDQQSWQP